MTFADSVRRARAHQQTRSYEPEVLDPLNDQARLEHLLLDESVRIFDTYEAQAREYFFVTHPELVRDPEGNSACTSWYKTQEPHILQGRWVYYPWLCTLAHVLSEEHYTAVRTARNNNLITPEEQRLFASKKIGIVGLSIGSNVAIALTLLGGGTYLRISDSDEAELSNLNRMTMGVHAIGVRKSDMVARSVYQLNPYMTIEMHETLSHDRADTFVRGLDIIIDECDDFAVKFALRKAAKKHRVALISGADVGDRAIVDIERYDLDPTLPLFAGRIRELSEEDLYTLDKKQVGELIVQLIEKKHVSERLYASLEEIGKTIISWPQLGTTALTCGAAVAQSALLVSCGRSTPNRVVIQLPQSTG